MKSIMTFLKTTALLLIGLLLLPFLMLLNFGTFGSFFKILFNGLTDVSLSEPEYRKQITFQQLITTPSLTTQENAYKAIAARVQAQDWLGMARHIRMWDQDRTKCEAGFSLAPIGLGAVQRCLAEAAYEGNPCHPDSFVVLPEAMIDQFETLAALHTEEYVFLALAAHARCHRAWVSRGTDYAAYVSEDGWAGMATQFEKAQWLLSRYDPVEMNAPLLAAARHALLAFMPDAHKYVYQYYEEWSALDPMDMRPHNQHAMMMLPRWFGSAHDLQLAAQKAANATRDQTGDAAYFAMYSTALDMWDENVLEIDFAAFEQGAHDLFALRGNDPAYVARRLEEMSWWTADGAEKSYPPHFHDRYRDLAIRLKALRKDLLCTRLTAIHGLSWADQVRGALDEVSALFQEDIKAGATFVIDQNGITVTPAAVPAAS